MVIELKKGFFADQQGVFEKGIKLLVTEPVTQFLLQDNVTGQDLFEIDNLGTVELLGGSLQIFDGPTKLAEFSSSGYSATLDTNTSPKTAFFQNLNWLPSASAGDLTGINVSVSLGNTRTAGNIRGSFIYVNNDHGTVSEVIAGKFVAESSGLTGGTLGGTTYQAAVVATSDAGNTSGIVSQNFGLDVTTGPYGSGGVVNEDAGIHIAAPFHTGTMNAHYGILMDDQDFGTLNYAIYTNAGKVRFGDDLILDTSGKGLFIKEGGSAKMGVATLSGGSIPVSNSTVTANSRIYLTPQTDSANAGFVWISARTPASGFTIKSSNGLDDRDVAWMIVEPA